MLQGTLRMVNRIRPRKFFANVGRKGSCIAKPIESKRDASARAAEEIVFQRIHRIASSGTRVESERG